MPRPFNRLSVDEFEATLSSFPFSRKITSVHLHHTWRPRQAEFVGLSTIEGMWRFHTETNGWSDIAQHLTIDPEGGIWTGRSWNKSPASASGFNGISSHGPLMIEMIGDFDQGKESMTDKQKASVLGVLAHLHNHHQLKPETLCFHNQMSGKTCPGSSISQDALIAEVAAEMKRLAARPRKAARDLPFGEEMLEAAQKAREVTRILLSGDSQPDDAPTAELAESGHGVASGRGGARGDTEELTPQVLDALRPHVINLRQGRFSRGGHFETSPQDVEALVNEHLKDWYEKNGGLQLLLYAHGGLNSEKKALLYAHQSCQFWKDNGIYPVFFVWETGLGETIGQLAKLAWDKVRGRRDLFDYTTDPLVENLVRGLGAVLIWGGMKRAAEKAADADGGGLYFAQQLRSFIAGLDPKPGKKLGIHAVGHSAGSIFHSHLLPQIYGSNGPRVRSLHFLAPAVTVDLFKDKLASSIGGRKKISSLSLFTMRKSLERADNVAKVYRKSLLYLVHRVIESERKTPILGLEKSLRADRELVDLFGLAGKTADGAEIIWSTTDGDSGTHASRSTTHGGFDNDVPTMNSVVRRVLGLGDMDPIHDFSDYPAAAAAARGLGEESLADLLEPEALEHFDFDEERDAAAASPVSVAAPATPLAPAVHAPASGRRRALCVGIDEYPTAPLQGCVNDSRTWADALREQGFEVKPLTNGQATRDNILMELGSLVESSRAGDVVVFQYAGHGTQLPDLDGDEPDGEDEAFVPFDYQNGAYLLDDDIGKVYDTIPVGVNLTAFIDCCHSGTLNRMLPGGDLGKALHGGPVRMRFMPVTDAMVASHKAFRSTRNLAAPRGDRVGREVHFAACQDYQSAWESNGQGDYTRIASPLLAQAVSQGWTLARLQSRIETGFAGNQRQKPNLVCDSPRHGEPLFAVSGGGGGAAPADAGAAGSADTQALLRQLIELLSKSNG